MGSTYAMDIAGRAQSIKHHQLTMLTVNNENLRVHVAPIGFEIDRVVMPASERRADRVWLLVHDNPAEDRALGFVEEVRAGLEEAKIEVRTESHDRLDLFGIIRAVRNVIGEERGNHVYVNLASGSKIQAIGCMMACMMFNSGRNVYPFYAEAETYHGSGAISSGIREIKDIPSYEIRVPDARLVSALERIIESGGRMTKKDLAASAEDAGLIKVNSERNAPQARFASLDKNIIQPLLGWGFVEVEKVGRTRYVSATGYGRGAAVFLSGRAQGS